MKFIPGLLFLYLAAAYEFLGDLTFYRRAGSGGSCSSSCVPSGFTTVTMNAELYNDDLVCGACLEGVYHVGGDSIYFDDMADNKCPECVFGDTNLGESGAMGCGVVFRPLCPHVDDFIATTRGNKTVLRYDQSGGRG